MSREWEARLYDSSGKRVRMPEEWLDSVEFEIGEAGGMQTGTMQLLVEWETLQLTGGEHVDIYLWGSLIYRGWVRIPQGEIGYPERKSPTLYGLHETLNGYRVRRNLAYASATSIELVFTDIVNQWVKRTGRLPSIVIDVTGVAALGLTLTSFDGSGKSVTQALNDLVGLSPGSLIWGCDVDGSGNDRVYLRPRSQTVAYKYAVGDTVKAFVYPQDTSQVVNAVYVTGGKLFYPNLAPNPSFEKSALPGEDSNLLLSPSFEDASGGSVPNWNVTGNPTADTSRSRTGSVSLDIDNNPGTEVIYQDVALPALPAVGAFALYVQCPVGETWHVVVTFDLIDGGGASLWSHAFTAFAIAADETWYRFADSVTLPSTVGAVSLRITINSGAAESGAIGFALDDVALWFSEVLPESWMRGQSHLANFAALDWQSTAVAAYDGDLSVRVTPNILGGGGYVEICTTPAARIAVKDGRPYWIAFYVSGDVVSPPLIAFVVRAYSGDTLLGTFVSNQVSVTSGLWHLESYFGTTAGADKLEIGLRFYNNNPASIDAAGVWENNLPTQWYPDQALTKHSTVADYGGSISAEASASITNYGLREDEVQNDQILDAATMDAFLIGYYNVHAVPAVQARLSLFGPTAPLKLDGTVKIVNLPASSEAPALFPSRVRYQIGEAITIEADLGNERPDLAGLLRAAAERVLR